MIHYKQKEISQENKVENLHTILSTLSVHGLAKYISHSK